MVGALDSSLNSLGLSPGQGTVLRSCVRHLRRFPWEVRAVGAKTNVTKEILTAQKYLERL